VKALADFKLDVDKLVKQDRYKSHADGERRDFSQNAKSFLFWDQLSKAEDFPSDGKAVFVHPVTALRLMAQVRPGQDHDEPAEEPGKSAKDRTHAEEDVVILVRDAKGPLPRSNVTVKADGQTVAQGKTDSEGELVGAARRRAGPRRGRVRRREGGGRERAARADRERDCRARHAGSGRRPGEPELQWPGGRPRPAPGPAHGR